MQKLYNFYFDLDGVLVDLQKNIEDKLNIKVDPVRYSTDAAYRKQLWRLIDNYEGRLWASAPELHTELLKLVPSYSILSSYGNRKHVIDQKLEWIEKHHLNPAHIHLVKSGADKAKWASPTSILIDDTLKVIEHWVDAGGIGIWHHNIEQTKQQLKKYLSR